MAPEKEEFARLIAIMGWDKSEAARQLHVSHSAINHLLNPNHPNKPSGPTLKLLKLMVAGAHPDAINTVFPPAQKRDAEWTVRSSYPTAEDRQIMDLLQEISPEKRAEVRRVLQAMLGGPKKVSYRKGKKP